MSGWGVHLAPPVDQPGTKQPWYKSPIAQAALRALAVTAVTVIAASLETETEHYEVTRQVKQTTPTHQATDNE